MPASPPVFLPADMLLPHSGVDLARWAVLACDQFTSEPEYWREVERLVGEAPSTLRIMLPEAHLEAPDVAARIAEIHATMRQYHRQVLTRQVAGFVAVRRHTGAGVRQGLVGCVDLDAYDYQPGAAPRIRPSEETVPARIPPRLAVRQDAPLESPHILMLIDDAGETVVEPAVADAMARPAAALYDVPLMLGGGQVTGAAVTDPAAVQRVQAALAALEDEAAFYRRYPAAVGVTTPFALAVGDGNHSLATAKAAWQKIKPTLPAAQQAQHPARHCLVELVNIHSPGVAFEAIHRVVFGLSAARWQQEMAAALAELDVEQVAAGGQCFTALVAGQAPRTVRLAGAVQPLAVGTVEALLARVQQRCPAVRVDYVHGEDSVKKLAAQPNTVGLLLPPLEKQDLFRGVALGGVMPKKAFSMGHAEDKRYYLECRAI